MSPQFAIDEVRLARYLIRVEDGYPDNPYHGRVHAADVLHSMHVILTRGNMVAAAGMDDLATRAAYLSAVRWCTCFGQLLRFRV